VCVVNAVRDCGAVGFLILLVGLLGVIASVVSLVTLMTAGGARRLIIVGAITVFVGSVAGALGPAGMMLGRWQVDNAMRLENINPAAKERIRAEGYREAAQCVPTGGFGGVFPLVIGAVALGVGIRRRVQHAAST
jgi:hypothetical protein